MRNAFAAAVKKSSLGAGDCFVEVQQDAADAGPCGQFGKLILRQGCATGSHGNQLGGSFRISYPLAAVLDQQFHQHLGLCFSRPTSNDAMEADFQSTLIIDGLAIC